MRIALVIAGPYPAFRGSQVLVSHLAAGLQQRGHQVRLVTYGPRRGRRPGPRPARLALDALLVARLWRTVRREKIDVIHAHNYEAGDRRAARRTRHGAAGRLSRAQRARRRAAALRVVACRTSLDGLARPVARRAGPAPGRRLHRGQRGAGSDASARRVSPGTCSRASSRRRRRPRSTTRPQAPAPRGLVCYAGNLDGYQNLDFLLRGLRARARRRAGRAAGAGQPSRRAR